MAVDLTNGSINPDMHKETVDDFYIVCHLLEMAYLLGGTVQCLTVFPRKIPHLLNL